MPFPGVKLRARREELGISGPRLAELIGKTRSYVSQLELGDKANPSYEVLEILCKVLKVPGGFFSDVSPTPLPTESPAEATPAPAKKPTGQKKPGPKS